MEMIMQLTISERKYVNNIKPTPRSRFFLHKKTRLFSLVFQIYHDNVPKCN